MIIGTCVPVGSELSVKDHARLSSFEDLKNLNEDGYRLVFVNLKGKYSSSRFPSFPTRVGNREPVPVKDGNRAPVPLMMGLGKIFDSR